MATDDSGNGWTRRDVLAGLGAVGIAGPVLLSGCGGGDDAAADPDEAQRPPFDGQPNFLVIVADDMRHDWLFAMPTVTRLIADQGRAFVQSRVNVPLCQPSRVAMVTGQMSKHNDVIAVGFGGLNIDTSDLVSKWLADAGYRCGLAGKFVNGIDSFGGQDPPPGFTFWRERLSGSDHRSDGYVLTIREEDRVSEHDDIYETDYLAREVISFIGDDLGPWACFVTPTGPHAPATPRRDLAKRYDDYDWDVVDETDVSDKPPWIQELPALTNVNHELIRRDVSGALEELAAVDDMVGKLLDALDEEQLRRTVVIFTSDNGIHCGEHRRTGPATKGGPYDVGLRVPLLVRGPGFEPGSDVTVPSMTFQDIVATMVDLAGATPGLDHQAGTSLRALLEAPDDHRQRVLLHEIAEGYLQSGDGITTGPDHELGFRKLYRYPSVRSGDPGPYVYEAYDLDTDPDEMSNWADDESRLAERDRLEKILDELLAAP